MEDQMKLLLESDFAISSGQIFTMILVALAAYGINYSLQRLSSFLFQQQILWVRRLRFWVPILRVVVWTATIFLLVQIADPPNELMFGLLASSGVAIGLAAQELVKNIFGAIVIWTDRVYSEGDRVKIEDVEGIVKAIGLRSTKVWTFDDTIISVPNAKLLTASVHNANSGAPAEQVEIDFYLPVDTDVEKAMSLARSAVLGAEYLDTEHPLVVFVFDMFDRRPVTKIRVKAYVRGVVYEKAFISEVTFQAKTLFREHGLYDPESTPPGDDVGDPA